ncbi:UDP-glycosyltransferase 91C1-like [Magnolia sinica]|uniref:UDP-glycosyltransferase 91C1-like n=1 Tax=Magnolia sinica TaxID=86752 RepID=UPI0026591B8F|nr:UDP-glycosyltransferase 91C1-like [Magnolia sinica]
MEKQGNLHIVMVPWLGFGHMIPYLELSKCLAQMGHRVSFLSTPRNIDRLPSVPLDLRSQINLVKLTPPPVDGLPEDAQSTVDVPPDHLHYLLKLLDELEDPLSAFLDGDPSPDWIIYDLFVYWAPRVAARYGIPTVVFGSVSAMTFSMMGPPSVPMVPQPKKPEKSTGPPPWVPFPTIVVQRYYEAVQNAKTARTCASGSDLTVGHRVRTTLQGCHAVAIRSCPEFEPEWIRLLRELYDKPVFPIGLLSPSISEINGTQHDTWVDQDQEWLDTQKQGSTVYVAFGSEFQLSKEQMTELAFGLEISEFPFFWAYRGDPRLLPLGFEERTKGRGFVRLGWAPQVRLLAHVSIGCFLTHGGWSSTIEGLALGKPLIMLSMFGDQGLNSRAMEERRVGVVVERNEQDGSFTREAVTKCLKLVMGEDEGGPIRSNAREMMKIVADKERHDQYIKEFADYLIQHRRRDVVPAHVR